MAFSVFVLDCDEYKFFGAYDSESDAEAAIKNECLKWDCTPGDEEYEKLYKEFRKDFRIISPDMSVV